MLPNMNAIKALATAAAAAAEKVSRARTYERAHGVPVLRTLAHMGGDRKARGAGSAKMRARNSGTTFAAPGGGKPRQVAGSVVGTASIAEARDSLAAAKRIPAGTQGRRAAIKRARARLHRLTIARG